MDDRVLIYCKSCNQGKNSSVAENESPFVRTYLRNALRSYLVFSIVSSSAMFSDSSTVFPIGKNPPSGKGWITTGVAVSFVLSAVIAALIAAFALLASFRADWTDLTDLDRFWYY